MEAIATYWYIWLAIAVIFGGIAIAHQFRSVSRGNIDKVFSDFKTTVLFIVVAYAGAFLFIVSIILNIIDYAKSA